MTIDFQEVTNHIDHMGLRGGSREDIMRGYIEDLLPRKYTVGNGVIVDVNGTQSKQQDFFVHDAFQSPIFLKYESYAVIPIESVYASIEVKSTLNKDTLRQSIENIRSVKKLELKVLKNKPLELNRNNIVFGAVFAYSSETSIETIAMNLKEECENIDYSQQPNIICILDKGVIIRVSKQGGNNVELDPGELNTIGIIKDRAEINLYLLYLLLQQHLNNTQNFAPDLMEYANQAGALRNIQTLIPLNLIPDDFSLPMGDTKFNSDEIRFMGKYNNIVYKFLMHQVTPEDLRVYDLTEVELEQMAIKLLSMLGNVVSKTEHSDKPDTIQQ